MKINPREMEWLREPIKNTVTEDRVEIITQPFTDLWQRTYYHFRNDNAPALQMKTKEKYLANACLPYIQYQGRNTLWHLCLQRRGFLF